MVNGSHYLRYVVEIVELQGECKMVVGSQNGKWKSLLTSYGGNRTTSLLTSCGGNLGTMGSDSEIAKWRVVTTYVM